jgi:hypothetical protein
VAWQVIGFPPTQLPAWQVSVCVQALPSEHEVPSIALPSAGHETLVPSQVSAGSQESVDSRQIVPLDFLASCGHAKVIPSQTSCKSQSPTAGLHTVPAGIGVALP